MINVRRRNEGTRAPVGKSRVERKPRERNEAEVADERSDCRTRAPTRQAAARESRPNRAYRVTKSARRRHDCTSSRSASRPGTVSTPGARTRNARRNAGEDHRPATESTVAGNPGGQSAAELMVSGTRSARDERIHHRSIIHQFNHSINPRESAVRSLRFGHSTIMQVTRAGPAPSTQRDAPRDGSGCERRRPRSVGSAHHNAYNAETSRKSSAPTRR